MSEQKRGWTPKELHVYESPDGFFSIYEDGETVYSDGPHHLVARDVSENYASMMAAGPELVAALKAAILALDYPASGIALRTKDKGESVLLKIEGGQHESHR